MIREPVYHSTPLKDLRPTQITVGMRKVEEKRKRWREKHGKKAGEFLAGHMIPVVLGPEAHHTSPTITTLPARCTRRV